MKLSPEIYGLPAWPPHTTPLVDTEWYQAHIAHFPFPTNRRSSLIEFSGLPSVGKTTLLTDLSKAGYDWQIPEVYMKADNHIEVRTPWDEDDDIPMTPWTINEGASFELQFLKTLQLGYLIPHLPDVSNKPILVERGPLDSLVWWYALWTYQGNEETFRVPLEHRTNSEYVESSVEALTLLATHVASVVIVGADREVLKERRKKSTVIHTDFYNHLSRWYGVLIAGLEKKWLHTGIGVLTVDGGNNPEENTERVGSYVGGMLQLLQ